MPSMLTPEQIENKLDRILLKVQKPGRYVGGELNSVVKDWDRVQTKVALIFPDIYDIGVSNVGLKILYDQVNQREDALAERAYAPWLDMEALMREHGIPLYTLESKQPLARFDLIGFSLPYETLYTNALNVLDLAGIPVRSQDRDETHPIIIAGGHSTMNPEPMHAFIDAFVIGEGEEVIHDIINTVQRVKSSQVGTLERSNVPTLKRDDLLRELAKIQGVYVPRFYEAYYLEDGTLSHIEPIGSRCSENHHQAHCAGAASAADAFHRAEHRDRPQPRLGRDHARLHARLPVLSRRDDHASRPRTERGRSPAGRRSCDQEYRIRGAGFAVAFLFRLHPRSGSGDQGR